MFIYIACTTRELIVLFIQRLSFHLFSLFLFLLGFPSHAQELSFYKYTDDQGITVISNTLPPSMANNGYTIVTARGNVLKTIEPKRTPEEIAKTKLLEEEKAKENERKAQEEKDKLEQARKDNVLLQTFTTADDIETLKKDKCSSIEILIGIAQGNIARLQEQLDGSKKSAETFEKSGKPIPKDLQERIKITYTQIQSNKTFLVKKEQEHSQITQMFDEMKSRYNKLKGQG